jgi:hypothetical protein
VAPGARYRLVLVRRQDPPGQLYVRTRWGVLVWNADRRELVALVDAGDEGPGLGGSHPGRRGGGVDDVAGASSSKPQNRGA